MSQGQYKDKSPVSQSLDTEKNKVESLVVNKLLIPMSDGQGTAVESYESGSDGFQKVNKLKDNGIDFRGKVSGWKEALEEMTETSGQESPTERKTTSHITGLDSIGDVIG